MLQEGRIAGAVLDVFYSEPLSPESKLWDMKNVVLTPHCADLTTDYALRTFNVLLGNLQRFLKGEPFPNICDKKLGY